ncbi:hypothetical protein Gotur_031627 [Gossypium turneri]
MVRLNLYSTGHLKCLQDIPLKYEVTTRLLRG